MRERNQDEAPAQVRRSDPSLGVQERQHPVGFVAMDAGDRRQTWMRSPPGDHMDRDRTWPAVGALIAEKVERRASPVRDLVHWKVIDQSGHVAQITGMRLGLGVLMRSQPDSVMTMFSSCT